MRAANTLITTTTTTATNSKPVWVSFAFAFALLCLFVVHLFCCSTAIYLFYLNALCYCSLSSLLFLCHCLCFASFVTPSVRTWLSQRQRENYNKKFVTNWEIFKGIFNVILTYLRHCVTRKKKTEAEVIFKKYAINIEKERRVLPIYTNTHAHEQTRTTVCVCELYEKR